MIRALVKADQLRVLGESVIVLHNPACRCSFIWMKRSKKKGFVKARPPCAIATELSSSTLPLLNCISSLLHTHSCSPFSSLSDDCWESFFHLSPGIQRSAYSPLLWSSWIPLFQCCRFASYFAMTHGEHMYDGTHRDGHSPALHMQI